MAKCIDLTGQRFGRLTIISRCGSDKRGNAKWKCICDCGSISLATTGNLKRRANISCGCYNSQKGKQQAKDIYDKHNYRGTLIHKISPDKRQSNNTTGVTGVYFDKESQKFRAQINLQGKAYALGRYNDLEGATKARKLAEEELFHPIIDEYKKENANV